MNRGQIEKKLRRNLCRSVVAIAVALAFLAPITINGVGISDRNGSKTEPITVNNGEVIAGGSSIQWSVTLNFNETGGKLDYVIFGEAPDANDGPPADIYDAPKPPLPMPPYLRAWFNNSRPKPYNELCEDYRQYSDTEKVWNMSVKWESDSSTSTNVTISWDTNGFSSCEYNSIVLMRYDPFNNKWDPVSDMLNDNSYVYTPRWFNEQWLTDQFQIIATGGILNNPPNAPINPNPKDGATSVDINADLSWDCSDPDDDALTYDIYFGTTSPPDKKVGRHPSASYDFGILEYNTRYYWKIVAYDNHNTSASSPLWSFTTKSSDDNSGGPGPDENNPPTADAGGPYTGVTGMSLLFNGSGSNDPDGTITNYTWHFGDGTMGYKAVTSHIYTESGNYTVTLTVTDDGGKKGSDMTYSSVTTVSSLLPSIPAVDGITKGKVTVDYSYTAVSTDPNNNAIRYIFEWGDNTNITMSPFMASGISCSISHNWSNSGMYIVTVYAENEKHAVSETASLTVFIDVKVQFINDIIKGYIIDNDNDGTYNIFYNDISGSETSVEKYDNGSYLVDSNGDSTWDYIYSIETGILEAYPSSGGNISGNTQQDNPVSIWVILLPVSFVIFIVAGILIFTYGVKKQKKEKQDASEKEKMEVEKRKKSE